MKCVVLHALLLLLAAVAMAQKPSVAAFYNETEEVAYYGHQVGQGQTLYALSKFYGVSVTELMQVNQLESAALSPDQKLVIPFDNEALHYQISDEGDDVPVIYLVKKKETDSTTPTA